MNLTFAESVKEKLILTDTVASNKCVCNICGLYIPKDMPRITTTPRLRKDVWGAHICAMCISDIARHIRTTYWRKVGRKAEQEMKEARRVESFLDRL